MANFARMLDYEKKTNTIRPSHGEPHGAPPPLQSRGREQQQRQQQQQQQQQQDPELILYIWNEKERSSRNALRLCHEVAVMDQITVVEVEPLAEDLPTWLRGVPTLLSVPEKTIWEGTDALDYVEDLSESIRAPQQQQHQQQQRQQPVLPNHGEMPMQRMPDGTQVRQRMPQMIRGADQSEFQTDGADGPAFSHLAAPTDDKVSSSDMKNEVDAILKRREMMMQPNTQQQPPAGAMELPTMDHRS